MQDQDTTLVQRAREAGRAHGKAAASWYFDGNTPQETYALVLKGIEEGDPAVLETFPSDPLSGEWADDPTPQTVWADLGMTGDEDEADDVIEAYEEGFYEASADEIERVARDMSRQTGSDRLLSNLSPRDVVELCEELLSRILADGVTYADFQAAQHAQTSITKARNLLRKVS